MYIACICISHRLEDRTRAFCRHFERIKNYVQFSCKHFAKFKSVPDAASIPRPVVGHNWNIFWKHTSVCVYAQGNDSDRGQPEEANTDRTASYSIYH